MKILTIIEKHVSYQYPKILGYEIPFLPSHPICDIISRIGPNVIIYKSVGSHIIPHRIIDTNHYYLIPHTLYPFNCEIYTDGTQIPNIEIRDDPNSYYDMEKPSIYILQDHSSYEVSRIQNLDYIYNRLYQDVDILSKSLVQKHIYEGVTGRYGIFHIPRITSHDVNKHCISWELRIFHTEHIKCIEYYGDEKFVYSVFEYQ